MYRPEKECETLFNRMMYTLKNREILDKIPFMSQNEVFRKRAEIADVNSLTIASALNMDVAELEAMLGA